MKKGWGGGTACGIVGSWHTRVIYGIPDVWLGEGAGKVLNDDWSMSPEDGTKNCSTGEDGKKRNVFFQIGSRKVNFLPVWKLSQ